MTWLRKHWYDLGGFLSIIVLGYVLIFHRQLTNFQMLTWLNFVSLFLHQLEEYRLPGSFPGMLNRGDWLGILKLIDWLADKDTRYVFEERNLLARDRFK